jgi:hypothetical protein
MYLYDHIEIRNSDGKASTSATYGKFTFTIAQIVVIAKTCAPAHQCNQLKGY